MLGRLKMTIDECIQQYTSVMGKVFPEGTWKKTRFVTKGEFYDEKPLEDAIKEIVQRKLGNSEAKLIDPDTVNENTCKM